MPRAETESVLRRALDWVGRERAVSSVAGIVGAPGLGKTMLLRVIEARYAEHADGDVVRALYLPHARLEAPDLAIWAYGLLGRPAPDASDAAAAVAALSALGAGPDGLPAPFLLLIDDADAIPAETLAALADGLAPQRSPLRLVLGLNADSRAARVLAALHPLGPIQMSLGQKLTVAEVADYLEVRMSWAGVPPIVRAEVDEDLVHRLHSLSGGVPRALQTIAAAAFDRAGDDGARATVEGKWRREEWMGLPIEDDLDARAPLG